MSVRKQMFITLFEIIDILVMTAAVGYIFMDGFKRRHEHHDPLLMMPGFDWHAFRTACLVTAPAIILHELGHKFMALALGLQATFEASYGFLLFGLVLKLIGSPFIFFVPAYVAITGAATAAESALVAFFGPLINLLFFGVSYLMLKRKEMSHRSFMLWTVSKNMNLFLFVFNMIPLPPFDGYKVFAGLFSLLRGLF